MGSRLQTLRVPCNFFSSPFPLTPCIAVIPSLPLSLSLFIFHPLLSAARSRISRFRPGVHSLLRLSRTRGEGEVEGVLGKSEINRESMVNNRENKRFVTNRRDDIRFSRGSRFISLSFSLSLLISYSLEQSCQLETDFLLTHLRKRSLRARSRSMASIYFHPLFKNTNRISRSNTLLRTSRERRNI